MLSYDEYNLSRVSGSYLSTQQNFSTWNSQHTAYKDKTNKVCGGGGEIIATNINSSYAIRPVFEIDNTKINITNGNGTPNNPYVFSVK